MKITVRRVTSRDELEQALDVAGAVQGEPVGPVDHTDWRFERLLTGYPADADLCLVALDGGALTGAVVCSRKPDGSAVPALLGVAPSHQGQGIGRRLMAAAEEAARATGVTRLHLGALPSAEAFYERLGYTCYLQILDGRQKIYEKRLADPAV